MTVTDQQHATHLLRLARDGDAESLECLLSSYIGYLKVLSHSQLDPRVRVRLSASDLVQESLLEAHRDFQKFAGTTTAEFTGWLRQILVHNAARAVETHLLAAKRDHRREHSLDTLRRAADESHARLDSMTAVHRRGPASEAEHQDDLTVLSNAIEKLSPEYRDVIVLRHVEGLAFAEIAVRMNRSSGAARMLWMRAIEKLRDAMSDESGVQ
ncbi:sigma-70 family RNA polymerase sigma factor [Rhodopirellula sallentina]|uniref:RNA polymerase sigma-E type, Rhodopirellula baltica n=1 Tax=Rhodopirellula sallentina SM41 TaxID=1263870 RepID=M5TV58_9BACT|nr:sigma-70 family RNA polymerase sigma factor [Rhodopirellula sallentina]EMI52929.1 RNA polymerase sigma-E type, Rhodopirellula baltica [Rhodopirellula sallentina SM41]